MAANVEAMPQQTFKSTRQLRKFTAIGSLTLFGSLLLLAFLLPIGYMGLTSVKSLQQVIDPNSTLLPTSPTMMEYQGQQLELYNVPMPDGTSRVLGLLNAYREDSDFVDPANPSAPPINWIGRWRTLVPVQHFDPTWGNYQGAWDSINMGILFRNTFVIAIAGTIGTLLSSIVVAYGFARFHIPGKNILFIILISTIVLPPQAVRPRPTTAAMVNSLKKSCRPVATRTLPKRFGDMPSSIAETTDARRQAVPAAASQSNL